MSKVDADLLANALEAIERGEHTHAEVLEQYPDLKEELEGLFDTIHLCRNYPSPAIESNFRNAARSRILSNMITQDPVTLSAYLRRIWKNTILVYERRPVMSLILIATLILSLLGGGTVYASQGSLPGDLLYSVKIAVEDTLLDLSSESRAPNLSSQYAGERVEEVKGLIEQQRFDHISTAMQRYEVQVRGADPEAVSVHREILTGLLDVVPDQAKPAIENAIVASSKYLDKLPQDLPTDGHQGEPTEKPSLPVEPPVVLPPDKPGNVPPIDIPVVPPVEPPPDPPVLPVEPPPGAPVEPPPVEPDPVPPAPPIEPPTIPGGRP